ncbi:MAG: zinc-ribbon domain-containing protein [Deltaproteobacteria bacterium]|nr:zinc-ribbon domain-containing protein [Deltaproteobacteria bacterium]
MRFTCQSCNAKYAIPDERVEGKVVRLKCQKCGGEIVVRGPPKAIEAEAKTVTQVAPAKTPRPEAKTTEAPRTAKIAPVSRIEDRPAVRLDDSASESAFGGGDEDEPRESTRIANLTELEGMRQKAAADRLEPNKAKPVMKAPTPSAPPAPADRAEWLALISGVQYGPLTAADVRAKIASGELHARSYMWREGLGEWQRVQSLPEFADAVPASARASAPASAPPTKAAKGDPSDFDAVFGPRGTPATVEAGARSVEDDLGPPEPTAEQVSDSHVISAPQGEPDEDIGLAAQLEGEEPIAPQRENTAQFLAASGLVAARKRRRIMIAAAVAIVLAIVLLIVLDLLGVLALPGMGVAYNALAIDNPHQAASQPSAPADQDQLSEEEKARLREGLLGKKKEEPKAPAEPRHDRKPEPGDAPSKPDSAEQKLLADVYGDHEKSAVRVEAPKFKTAEQDLPDGITGEAIAKVVESNQRAVKFCLERELKRGGTLSGRLELEFTIAPSGMVQDVDIKSAKFRGTDFGACVVQAVKSWRFPRFSGAPVPVEYPFILSSGM